MRSSTFPPAALAELHSACETEPALLNSERIEQRFGSFGIAILPAEPGLRRSSIFSRHGDSQICRTYAVVRFAEQPVEWYREEHAKVLAGNSIGAIFRSHGWDVHKQTLHIGSLTLPDKGSSIAKLMQLGNKRELAMHVYQLLLVRREQVFEYATIVETHHPAYLTETDLNDLYEFDASTVLSSATTSELTSLVLDTHE
ncbi:MAG: hypothetical protein ACR2QZ_03740 [Woeseiaceae bacterium]